MNTPKNHQNTTKKERIKFLQDVVQRNYDNDNWYGFDSNYEKRRLHTIAAQVELIQLTGKEFEPTYTPAI